MYQSVAIICCFLAGDAECMVRCSPGEDATNGFFVSCFVRQSQASKKLGKRSRSSVSHGADEVETGEGGESVIHMEKSAAGQKRSRPKKKRKSSMPV
jgi:putative methyltransferase